MRIREFALADYEAAVSLWERVEHLGGVPRDDVERKLARDPELFLVAEEDNGALVGVVMGSSDGRRGWISRLAVDPGRQRSGIGRALVEELERRLAALGVPQANLLVMDENAVGLAFWASLGYASLPIVMHSKRLDGAEQRGDC